MAFIIKPQKQEKSKLSNSELFEMFMFKIGQYTKDDDGNILITGPYIDSKELGIKFRDWLKKK